MNIGSFEVEFKNKLKRLGMHPKFRILKIKGLISDFPSLGGLWQRKQPTNFLTSLSLLSLA